MVKRKYKTSYPLGVYHYSDCAVHNEPAFPNGECSCQYYKRKAHEFAEMFIGHPLPGAPVQRMVSSNSAPAEERNDR